MAGRGRMSTTWAFGLCSRARRMYRVLAGNAHVGRLTWPCDFALSFSGVPRHLASVSTERAPSHISHRAWGLSEPSASLQASALRLAMRRVAMSPIGQGGLAQSWPRRLCVACLHAGHALQLWWYVCLFAFGRICARPSVVSLAGVGRDRAHDVRPMCLVAIGHPSAGAGCSGNCRAPSVPRNKYCWTCRCVVGARQRRACLISALSCTWLLRNAHASLSARSMSASGVAKCFAPWSRGAWYLVGSLAWDCPGQVVRPSSPHLAAASQ